MIKPYVVTSWDFIFNVYVVSCVVEMPRRLIVPSADAIAKKWKEEAPKRATYYQAETPAAADTWEANTKAAKATYKASLLVSKIEERFAGGVDGQAGKFKRKVVDVGVDRYGPGIEAAESDMRDGIGPYRDVLDGLEVPDRKPRGDPANLKIVEKIFKQLHAKRLSVLGASPASK